ncbi:hypothetical protein [Ascidiimonas sp. W6]|uniref:hypothetical protein n=1 Tax=Ascidiimonas meishanensis TaxID=3128903 RepID=UPI0030EC13E0
MKNLFCTYSLFALLVAITSCSDLDDDANVRPPEVIDTVLITQTTATDTDGNRYEIGFNQAGPENQNPFVRKKTGAGQIIWTKIYEDSPVNGKAELIQIDDQGNVWVIFSLDGGSNESGFITQKEVEGAAFSNVYQSSYGSGGGPRVAVITRINPATGLIIKGSFVTARLNNGDTNTLRATKTGFNNGNFAFESSTASFPPGTGTAYEKYPNITDQDRVDGAFKVYYELNFGLSEITRAVLLIE